MRQHVDHCHWYDRTKLTLKDIHNTQYVACMNPTAGSFTIDARLQVRPKPEFINFNISFMGVVIMVFLVQSAKSNCFLH